VCPVGQQTTIWMDLMLNDHLLRYGELSWEACSDPVCGWYRPSSPAFSANELQMMTLACCQSQPTPFRCAQMSWSSVDAVRSAVFPVLWSIPVGVLSCGAGRWVWMVCAQPIWMGGAGRLPGVGWTSRIVFLG
jgi:hypothetical protein